MPIYEYKCKVCEKVSDFLEGVGTGEIDKKCKYCGSNELEKAPSTVNVSKSGRTPSSQNGLTCCGRTEQCEKPPCSDDGSCKR